MLPNLTLATWRAVVTPLHVLAISSTVFRLWHRRRQRQLWWDDFWAALSLSFDLVYATIPFLKQRSSDPRPARYKERQIIVFWLSTLSFPLVLWFARISIGMSIARIVPPQTRVRYLLYAMNVVFGLMLIGQMLHKIIVCTRDTSWHNNEAVQCYVGSGIGVLTLCTDLFADTCLVAIPVRMLWHVKLPRTQRRLILSIFASSFLSSLIGIVYTVFVFLKQKNMGRVWGMRVGLISGVKGATTLFVCNLLVIVMFLYRMFWKDETDTVSEPSETRSKPTHPLPLTSTFMVPNETALVLTEISAQHTPSTRTSLSRSSHSHPSIPCKDPWPITPPNHCVPG